MVVYSTAWLMVIPMMLVVVHLKVHSPLHQPSCSNQCTQNRHLSTGNSTNLPSTDMTLTAQGWVNYLASRISWSFVVSFFGHVVFTVTFKTIDGI